MSRSLDLVCIWSVGKYDTQVTFFRALNLGIPTATEKAIIHTINLSFFYKPFIALVLPKTFWEHKWGGGAQELRLSSSQRKHF